MPQLDTSTFAGQIFWLLVAYLILFAVVRFIATPRLLAMAGQRDARRGGDLAAAEAARAAEQAGNDSHVAEVEAAHVKARAALAEANDRTRVASAAKLAALGADLRAKADGADAALATARASTAHDLADVADDLARALVARLTGGATAGASA